MSEKEMPKAYEAKETESKWYKYWEDNGLFHVQDIPEKTSYTIVIPPPNVTGALHMGHALNNTLQDILIRMKRMQGYSALWQPGTDHAGIATQNVVERQLMEKEGKKRHDIGREALIERIWKWRDEYGDRILKQLRSLGASCDWERTRFTLDEGLSRAVREAFVKMYEEGLIYRGKYIVNWCPRCHTALADDEVDHEDENGKLWHIRYPFAEREGYVVIATTRPETLLGDTAVAVNPKDERYANLIGEMLLLPETDRKIPLLADDFVDASFGTGAVKVTPAHDPNDFQIGERHNLPRINVMNEEAVMNDEAGEKYKGLSRDDCRKKIVRELEIRGLLEKIEDHAHAVGHCYRCKTTIEPWLSDQWFVRMRPLAEKAIRATEEGKVSFHPKRWTQFYMQWLENARDWCISRQIWWGHRIPVWYCSEERCPPIVAKETPAKCPHCSGTEIRQDEDVLDTWFSSSLWPFSTLGWPGDTELLKNYYPTSTLVTDRGIIYFWVARMVMMGLEMMGEVPFSDVYIHGTILDEQGRKMSKSLGNGIDPLEIIEKYGSDAMRFSLVVLSTEGQDLKLSESKFEMGRNFCNKLWNATRFALMNLKGFDGNAQNDSERTLADKWIISRLEQTIADVTSAMNDFRFSVAAQTLYHFVWNDLCDWYLEASKLTMTGNDAKAKHAAQATLFHALGTTLKLLHPFLPFITEELWHQINPEAGSIMAEAYPEAAKEIPFKEEAEEFDIAREIISSLRNIRGEHNVKPSNRIDCFIKTPNKLTSKMLEACRGYIEHLSRIADLHIGENIAPPKEAATAMVSGCEISIPYAGLIDIEAEKARLNKEISKAEAETESVRKKLSNEGFTARAPKEIVDKERARLAEGEEKLSKLREALAKLD
ncbi:MAG TPA: valine--tRNA ligase [bacterium]|nr:valine--tRNA ligase [bacterium]